MRTYNETLNFIETKHFTDQIKFLYTPNETEYQKNRYTNLINKHKELFNSDNELYLISAPGRIEVTGNHTDHNNGKVLAASITKDALACVSKRKDGKINVHSLGYSSYTLDINNLGFDKNEYGTTTAIIKGIAYKISENYKIGGFDAVITSDVLSGSGLSSSAALENLIASIFNYLYNDSQINEITKAKIGQYTENVYFGKPSGLLDQSASCIGGCVYMDYETQDPVIQSIHFDLEKHNYSIIVVNTRSSHDDLTDAYAKIPYEMKEIASYFNKSTLREINEEIILDNIDSLRKKLSDRAILRSLHYFNENNLVDSQVDSLKNDNIKDFLSNIIKSGRSSFMYLQNIYCSDKYQPMALALLYAEKILNSDGAWRVHGGGFAGTTLNFVPNNKIQIFKSTMEKIFGENCCIELSIRPVGSYSIKFDGGRL